ncbi:MAG TPA: Ig-like domain-containing protein, partial [Anaerolineales bacterium]|nr:Ig-like domain-containing protein [Anaerolineales bacterium]
CVTAPELSLNGSEPLSGYTILAIEGSLNGQVFACSGSSCSVPLNEGSNDFSFWALSSYGDSSTMGTASAKVDTVSPSVGLDLSGSNGTNGWFVSLTTVSAAGSDSTSGLSNILLSVNNGIWQSSATLNEGVYNVDVQAEDNAGNISNSSTTISVDTTTPMIDVSVNGTAGNNGWYSSSMQVTATANDATSGIGTLEASIDSGVYVNYRSPITYSDGYHTVQFKATDKAGNETETSVQEFYVDTIAPAVDLPAQWEVNDVITYKVQDDGSGLSALRIVIEDEDEKFAKVAWDEIISGNKFKGEIVWNGKFKDGTVTPAGEYLVWVKVSDFAGNERIALGRVIVPQPFASFSLIQPNKSSGEVPTPPADLFDSKDSSPLPTNPNPDLSTSPSASFGGSEIGNQPTAMQSLSLASGASSASSTTPSNILWGATAAAMLGATMAYALDERRKRKENEARRQAEVASHKHAPHRASQNEEPPMTRQEKELAKQRKELQKIWDANGAAIYEANQEYQAKHGKEMDAGSRSKAIKDATVNGVFNAGAYASNLETAKTRQEAQNERMANKMTRVEREEEVRWQASQKAAEEKQKAEELQSGYAAYYVAMRQGEQEAKSNGWDKAVDYVKENIVRPVQELVQTISNPAQQSHGRGKLAIPVINTSTYREDIGWWDTVKETIFAGNEFWKPTL